MKKHIDGDVLHITRKPGLMIGTCDCGWMHRINLSSGNVTLQESMVERLMSLHSEHVERAEDARPAR